MPLISTKSLSQIRLSWLVAAQASAAKVGKFLDFSVGSVNLALAEGAATLGLWLQKVALQVLSMSRLATSDGADADSWGAQFQFFRLENTRATGLVTVSRATTTTRIVVAVGQQFKSFDGAQSFTVYSDTSNQRWSAADNGYVLSIGIASITVPIQADTPGIAGNVVAGTITVIVGNLDGADEVTNPADFLNGLDQETDAAYKARFPNFLAGLARANRSAIVAAIESVQQGVQYVIIENQNAVGAVYPYLDIADYFDQPGGFAYPTLVPWPGLVLVVIDDGSGEPSLNLIGQVQSAIEAVRGLAVQFKVLGPSIVNANVNFAVVPQAGYLKATLDSLATTAVQNYLNSLPLGTQLLPLTRIAQVAYDAVAGVANVPLSSITINGVATDLTVNQVQVIKAGTIGAS